MVRLWPVLFVCACILWPALAFAENPKVSAYDVQVGAGQTYVEVPVRIASRTGYTFALRYRVMNGKGTHAPVHFPAGQQGEFLLAHDVDEWRVPVRLNRPLAPGQTIRLQLEGARTYGSWGVELSKPAAVISRASVTPPPKGGVSVLAGTLPRRSRPASYQQTFWSDLIEGFEATDSGYGVDGRPVWKTQLGHGRTQNNGELGIATDPALHPGVKPFQVIDGHRALVAERLPSPITYKGKAWRYSSPVLTTETLFRMGYGWSEARLALEPAKGLWPAFWAKPSPHWIWPPELDHLEVAFKDSPPEKAFPFFTQWWKAGGKAQMRGSNVNVHALLPEWRWDAFHTYAVHWTPTVTEWIVDGVLVHSQPTLIKLGSDGGADQDGKLYLKLNVAVGGMAGAPDDAALPAAMKVAHVAVFEPAQE